LLNAAGVAIGALVIAFEVVLGRRARAGAETP